MCGICIDDSINFLRDLSMKIMLLAADTFKNPDVLISELEEAGKSTIEFKDNLNQIYSAWLSAFWPG